jgi:uncharacterized repeat protein (TIGR03803 family)
LRPRRQAVEPVVVEDGLPVISQAPTNLSKVQRKEFATMAHEIVLGPSRSGIARRAAKAFASWGLLAVVLLYPSAGAGAGRYEILHKFVPYPHGVSPATVIQGQDGNLYGVAYQGGEMGFGTIFSVDRGGELSAVHSFRGIDGWLPARLIESSDGRLYGTTFWGGPDGHGSVFRFERSRGTATLLSSFSLGGEDGEFPYDLVEAADGSFYGTTLGETGPGGTIFRLEPHHGGEFELTTLKVFECEIGRSPHSLIEAIDGSLYGASGGHSGPHHTQVGCCCGGGLAGPSTFRPAIFNIDQRGELTILHAPASSATSLIHSQDETLFGTTLGDGINHDGTVFSLVPGAEIRILHAFNGSDGAQPYSLILASDGTLYGTTATGGANSLGTVFTLAPGSELITLHSFAGQDGQGPNALIEGLNGGFFGTTSGGGTDGVGTVFRLESSGKLTTLASFTDSDSAGPRHLIEGSDGNFYGIAVEVSDLRYDPGSIFRLGPEGSSTKLHSFDASDGAMYARLIQAKDGSLYGTTPTGSESYRFGRIFKFDPERRVMETIHAFDGTGGSGPSSLIQTMEGDFYGTTGGGGEANCGTIFRLGASSGFASIYHFSPGRLAGDACSPYGLIQASSGTLYGATGSGSGGAGTVFKFTLTGELTILHTFFRGTDGSTPNNLIEGPDGSLYGTALSGGTDDWGSVFRLDPQGAFTTLHVFRRGGAEGGNPLGLTLARSGLLYGTTILGGPNGAGTLFQIDMGGTVTALHAFSGGSSARFPEYPRPWSIFERSDGGIYGVAPAREAHGGVVFHWTPSLQRPGDCNQDGKVDLSDAVCLLGFLFLASPASLPCGDGASADLANRELLDWNDDAALDLSDAVGTLTWLFLGGPPHALGSGCRAMSGCPDACAAF